MATLLASAGLAKALAVGGTILSGVGTVASGIGAKKEADYTASQLEAQATAERASAQREAIQERKQKDLVISRAKAVGASSGGGVDLNILGKIEEAGEYNALTALWEGEERARGAENQAAATRWGGKRAKLAGFIGAGSDVAAGLARIRQDYGPRRTVLDDGESFYDKYARRAQSPVIR
jgi:hypothetical protein